MTAKRKPSRYALYRFINHKSKDSVYVAWSVSGKQDESLPLTGNFWVFDTSQVNLPLPVPGNEIKTAEIPLFLAPAPGLSPVIGSIGAEALPQIPFPSDGDLWFSTWADDDNLYASWGDGKGPLQENEETPWVDMGIARISGYCPQLQASVRYREDPVPR